LTRGRPATRPSTRRSARVALCLVLVLVLGAAGCGILRRSPAAPDLVKLTFLQVNDLYTLDPVDEGRRGGMARLATLVKELRGRNANTLLVIGGDFLAPSILSTYLKGRQMVVAFNDLGLDVATFGNHDFDFGPAVLAERMRESRFVWISSNVRDRRTGGAFGGAQHDRIVGLGGLRVGLLGLTLPDTTHTSSPGPDVLFADPMRIGVETAAALRHRGAQIVVAVTHLDMDSDRRLADTAAIDVILGGHEHEPLVAEGGRALVTKAGSDGRYLVQVDLWVTRTGTVVERSWTFHEVSARIAPDPAMEKVVAGFTAQLDRELGAAIGRTEVALDLRRNILRTQETGIGNFVTDVMRAAHGADAALINGGGIRGDRVVPPGPLTRRNVHEMVPFTNTVVKIELTGAALRQTLEHGLLQADNQGGGFLQVSGVQLVYDPSGAAGHRITSLGVGGRPLDPGQRYTVAVPDFLARGGDGHAALPSARLLVRAADAPDLATLVLRAIEARTTIAPAVEGRIRPAGRR
jgi:2',3'-cyclic-nucleotide 2'-phosphodiesterase (5'-nucleotidase family)